MYEHVDASLSKVLLAANNQQGQMACPRKTSGPSKASFGSLPFCGMCYSDLLQDLHMVLAFLQAGFLEMCKEPNTTLPRKKIYR